MQRLIRDGVALAYEERGSGPAMLLVHGWACDHTYLEPQAERFSRDRRVVSVDLRGHGASDKPQQDYTIGGFAEDMVWLCAELGLRSPVVVGHSMGGLIGYELAARFPDLPAAIVALDSPMVMPQRLYERLPAGAEASGSVEGCRIFVNDMFLPTDDPERRHRIVEQMCGSTPAYVRQSAWRQLFACASSSSASAEPISVPLLVIASAGGHMADLRRLKDLCPRLAVGQTVGSGHFHQLEVPEQVNTMIARFLATSL
jgi:pimeloyl-ACP methyl ester carboxylesterase